MKVDGAPFRTIWLADDGQTVEIIDQARLPHEFVVVALTTVEDAAHAISAAALLALTDLKQPWVAKCILLRISTMIRTGRSRSSRNNFV